MRSSSTRPRRAHRFRIWIWSLRSRLAEKKGGWRGVPSRRRRLAPVHRSPPADLRLLLRHAMQCAKTPDQVARVNGCNLAGGEQLRQRVERDAVVGMVEHRNKHV